MRAVSSSNAPSGSITSTAVGLGATSTFVPHRRVQWRTWQRNWKGTLVAAGLLLLYEAIFPVVAHRLVRADTFGGVAVFAVLVLLFFYYLAVILLLGAGINLWSAGQRETASDLPGILHAVQVHGTLRGAAGPTGGQPQEEMQQHKGGGSSATLARWPNGRDWGVLSLCGGHRPAPARGRPPRAATPDSHSGTTESLWRRLQVHWRVNLCSCVRNG
jgi:hypothetical protein